MILCTMLTIMKVDQANEIRSMGVSGARRQPSVARSVRGGESEGEEQVGQSVPLVNVHHTEHDWLAGLQCWAPKSMKLVLQPAVRTL